MQEQESNLPPAILKAAATGKAEHILNILKAGLATTPFCGGIASLLSDYIPSSKFKRLERFAEQIASDLGTLQGRVDEQNIQTDEFAYIFEKCFQGASDNYQEEKFEAFRGILNNSAIGTDLSQEEKEYFLNLVTTLSVLHIRILKFMARPTEYLSENNIPSDNIQGGFSQFFPIAIPGIDLEVIKCAFDDLYQYGLVGTDKKIFHTMTSGQGLQLLGNRVSPLGEKFIKFCSTPE
jgi:hypothetical protein